MSSSSSLTHVGLACMCVLLCASVGTHAAIAVPTIISSNMVLQRAPQSAVLWGTADPVRDGPIVVTLDGQYSWNASLSSNGNWRVELDPQDATPDGTSHTITITGNINSIKISNVLFGDVWLCGGQSNMEFTLGDAFNGTTYIKQSTKYRGIRYFTVQKTPSDTPLTNETSKDPDHLWGLSGPDVVGGPTWTMFSATCFFFGTNLYQALNDEVPLGLIASNWGGTQIEWWSSPDALAMCANSTAAEKERALNANSPFHEELVDMFNTSLLSNSQLYNGMIAPLLNMTFKGVIWYQGEQNAAAPVAYSCQFPAMIADWRAKFGNDRLYFYFVMLAAYPDGEGLYAAQRQAQLSGLSLPHTGVALAVDLGDPTAPLGSIHPRNKEEVGRRLFLAAWADAYEQDVVSTGPMLTHIDFPGTGNSPDNRTFVLHYAPDASGQGLMLRDTEACTKCCAKAPAFTIQTQQNQAWTYGSVSVSSLNYRVYVSLSSINAGNPPIGISHAWLDYPECMLANSATLPSLPFQQLYTP